MVYMEPEEKALIWGLEWVDGDNTPQAVKFIMEVKCFLGTLAECPIYKKADSLSPSQALEKAFIEKDMTLSKGTEIMPLLEAGGGNEYVVTTKDGDKGICYILRQEGEGIDVYNVEEHVVRTNDIVNIIGLHKCCEDFIRVTTQKEKAIRTKSITELIANLATPAENLHTQMKAAHEEGLLYEEFILNTCTDEFGLTYDQSLKVLALLRASIEEYTEEAEVHTKDDHMDVPYHM